MTHLSERLKDGRLRLAIGNVALFVIASTLLRVVLVAGFASNLLQHPSDLTRAFAVGLHLDLVTGVILSAPIALWAYLRKLPPWREGRMLKRVLITLSIVWSLGIFSLAAEAFFFEEFHSRYNTVAVDYIIYPHEVFINIWDSYPVAWVIAGCILLATLLSRTVVRFAEKAASTGSPRSPGKAAAWVLASVALGLTASVNETRFSAERTANEVASNSFVSFLSAVFTRNLDYTHFYPSLPREEAFRHARKLIIPGASTQAAADTLVRTIPGDPNKPQLNLILLLEESLGSEFWGCLGRTNTLTPRMDEIATREALLFDNMYADGNRTIRGYEGVFSSFPPLPGDSIVARDRSEHVETIARVLQRDGYDTTFIYAGRGVFDGTRKFAASNGWEHFLELKDFKNPVFTTVWGVCNEDLYDRAIDEARARHKQGKPFFLTTMSVSNHKPFTYPKGRIPEDPDQRRREHAVKYTDYALGRFFDMARKEDFWTNTIVCVVADHGARVYGSQTIPIKSYEIPFFVSGAVVPKKPQRISTLGCQLDVAPTLLGLIGRPYTSTFFGHDLLKENAPSRVLINHNRSVGIYADERLITFSLMNKVEYYAGNPKTGQMKKVAEPDARMQELQRDATALYQVGDDLYMNRRYRVDAPAAPAAAVK